MARQPRVNPTHGAVRAALAIPARSGWIKKFDDAKRARLAKMLGFGDALKAAELIRKTESAVIELAMDDERKRTKAKRDLAALVKAARAVVRTWAKVKGGVCYIPLRHALHDAVPGGNIVNRDERVVQIERVMAEDVFYVMKTAEQMLATAKEGGKVRRPAEYLCATKIALAWHEATGKDATLTRNIGHPETAFQQFIAKAAPSIAETTWRNVVESLGSKSS
jgi:hypothetical protein